MRYAFLGAILIIWGLWGFLPKLTVGLMPLRQAILFHALGGLLVGLGVAFFGGGEWPPIHWRGALMALATGIMGVGGSLLYYHLLKDGSVTVTMVLTHLYPVVTVLLAVLILGETLTWKQGLATLFALASITLFAL